MTKREGRGGGRARGERLSQCGVISFTSGEKKIEDLCSRVGNKNTPGSGSIDSLFKRPLTLHTLR